MLDWFPNVDHLPIYVAREKGYFREAGIEVKILSPSDTSDALKLAVAGQVDRTPLVTRHTDSVAIDLLTKRIAAVSFVDERVTVIPPPPIGPEIRPR